ncbi:MAG TPA: NAD(P)-dependent oxidoreductase [Rubrobacter sp.]|nr:NAD(P)-dependent oxidoreductase [Rubrobacter sp.]
MERLAFVGLGAMGSPMAKRLVGAGFELKVFDVLDERTHPLIELGAVSTASLGEAAEGTEALVLMVANAEQAEGVLFGEGGAAEALSEGAAVVVMSTIGPEAVRELADALAERGLRTLDAPVSGGVARAEKGDLLIMAGGPEDLFEELRPVLGAMGSSVAHCGARVGDGQAVKLVNQLLCGVHIAAAGEALAYAEALDLDPRFVFETIRHGAANSFMLQDRGERMLNEEFVPPKSALDIFVKDMGLVRKAAEERGFETPLSSAALELYLAGKEAGLGNEDDSGIIRMFRQR